MNFLAEKPRLFSKSLEQSKEKLFKFCSCDYSNNLLEAELDLWEPQQGEGGEGQALPGRV